MRARHDGRVAVITGGAGGIGRAYVVRPAGEGAALFHTVQALLPDVRAAGWIRTVNTTSNSVDRLVRP